MTPTDILKKQLKEIQDKRFELKDQFKTNRSNQCIEVLKMLGFNPTQVNIDSDSIRVHIPEVSHWDALVIRRPRTYQLDEGPKFGEPTLEYRGGGEISKESDLKYISAVGKLAEHYLNKTETWNGLVGLMSDVEGFYNSEEYVVLSKQDITLEKTIRELETKEKEDTFSNVFKTGHFKLKKSISFYYGSGKYDRVNSDEWIWEENKGGKTYTMFYYENCRTNPYYDAEGNTLPPTFERTKRTISKRIRKDDVVSFVKYNMSQVED
jgi:hypothetical protein